MKNTHLLTVALLASTLLISPAFAQKQVVHSETVTQSTTKTVKPLSINNKTNQVKPSVQHFVELINSSRLDIAMKQPQNAVARLDEAQKLAEFIKSHSSIEEITHETRITSGRVMYSDETTSGAYYVPFETGPVKLKTVQQVPSDKSNKPGLAVSSAEVVYLTVDLSGDEANQYITQAKAALAQGDAKEADKQLSDLMSKVVIAENADSLPYEKARDNLDLALNFLQDDEDYQAARYALTHSIEGLKEMSKDSRFNTKASSDQIGRVQQIHDLLLQENKAAAEKARTEIKAAQGELAKLKV